MSKLEANTIAPSTGTTLTIGESGDTVTLGSGASLSGFGVNTPAFHAYLSASQTGVTSNTATKVTLDTTLVDTDSAFASNKFTVPSGGAGKYYLYGALTGVASATSRLNVAAVKIYVNGSQLFQAYGNYDGNFPYSAVKNTYGITTLAVGDYVELYGQVEDSTAANVTFSGGASASTFLGGYKIIE